MFTTSREPAWWLIGWREVVIRIRRPHEDEVGKPSEDWEKTPSEDKTLRAGADQLQAALDKAWLTFGDPSKRMSDPTPFFARASSRDSNFHPEPSRPTAATGTGRRKRAP